MDLSIIIPVYNEAHKIPKDIQEAQEYLTNHSLSGEIIVSDDGSNDNTKEVVKELRKKHDNLVLLENPHRGKGGTVREGMIQGKGKVVLFIDSGSCIPYSDVNKGFTMVNENKCDIAHASRFLPDSQIDKPKSLFRQLLSRAFRMAIPLYIGIYGKYSDTQCGLKIYSREAAHKIYNECFTNGFMIDIETIMRAEKHKFIIQEFPIHWFSDPDSRLTASKTFLNMLRELRRIKKEI